jgi:hypothetical protein
MSNESNIRHGRHCDFKLHVHWVFVAKYRRCVFDAEAIDILRGITMGPKGSSLDFPVRARRGAQATSTGYRAILITLACVNSSRPS